jgi:hypothetical protein
MSTARRFKPWSGSLYHGPGGLWRWSRPLPCWKAIGNGADDRVPAIPALASALPLGAPPNGVRAA